MSVNGAVPLVLAGIAALVIGSAAIAVIRAAVVGARVPLCVRARRNGLWPLMPILAWNLALAPHLSPVFSDNHAIPTTVLFVEAIGRVFTFGAPLALLLEPERGPAWRWGLGLFVVGGAAYLAAWVPPLLDLTPSWLWLGPYLLPASWLVGLGLMTRSRAYIVGVVVFAVAHGIHGVLALQAVLG